MSSTATVRTFGFRGLWGQIGRIEEGFRRIGCKIAGEGEAFDFIYSNELLQDRGAIACKEKTGKPLIRHIQDLPAYENTSKTKTIAELQTYRDQTLAHADRVTTNTRFVAGQLERYWGYRGAIIAGQPLQFDPDLDEFRTRKRRNLAVIVGRLDDPLKNSRLAIEALSLLRSPPDLAMIWVGKAKHKPRSFFRRFRIEHHHEIPSPALAALVKTARVALAPSLFEGLGLPPIEALAAGTPAIVSDIPVKREVFADIPMLFHDPTDPRDLARAIQFLLDHEEQGWNMVDAFAPKAEFYRPESVAATILAAYREVADGYGDHAVAARRSGA
ncbi:MAG TPA: glycosyltransferase [Stellaceae bacterium]|nr:glycosyltransferase [Stellaceae bacterium]